MMLRTPWLKKMVEYPSMKEGLQLDRLILIVCVPIYPNDTDREDVDWLILILTFIQSHRL